MLRRRRLQFESLESRRLLAVDLTVVDVQFVDPTDVFGASTDTPVVGQKIVLRADVSLSGFAGGELYDLRFDVDGVPIDVIDAQTSAGNNLIHIWARDGWVARPETLHKVTVTVDPNNSIVEMDETNNAFSFQFESVPPTSLPEKFVNPLAGEENVDWITDGYVDVNPEFCFACAEDFRGNQTLTRDFHNGIDFRVINFAQADRGVDVLAAASGTVTLAQDGNFDRRASFNTPVMDGNRVFVDHGNGWVSQYYHLQRDSVTVSVGDPVTAGQVIGRVGSSGNSLAPHLHFEIQRNHSPVEPFVSPNDYFVESAAYTYEVDPVLHDLGITTNFQVFRDVVELPSDNDALPAQTVGIYPWAVFSSIEPGDSWEMRIYRPDGTEYEQPAASTPIAFPTSFPDLAGSWQWNNWWFISLANPEAGNWRAEVLVNGTSVGEETFVVGRILPEMRVLEDLSDTATIEFDDPLIIDNRRTPLDFGEVAQAATSPTKTFIVENHGFADLTISSMQLPTGFSIAEPLSTTIAPTSSDLFSIAMDTSATGPMSGTVTIVSNDHAAADLDSDGDVDGVDFLRLQRGLGITSGASVADGDANGNDTVGADDLLLWNQQYAASTETVFEFHVEGEVTPPSAASSAIPAFQWAGTNPNREQEVVVLEEAIAVAHEHFEIEHGVFPALVTGKARDAVRSEVVRDAENDRVDTADRGDASVDSDLA